MAIDLEAWAEGVSAQLDRLTEAPRLTPEWLGVSDAAIYSGLSEETLRKLGASGKIVLRRPVRGRVLINRRELDNYIRSSTAQPRTGRGIRA